MKIFFTLFFNLIPLYLISLLGFFAGKFLNVQKQTLSVILIYIIAPVVIFNGVLKANLTFQYLFLPFLFFILACFICLIFFRLGKFFWNDSTKNILAFSAGTGNTGYFGLPVALILLGDSSLSIVVFIILGVTLYENSLGFYVTAKANFTARDSVKKLLRLPTLYAFFAGVFFNLIGFYGGNLFQSVVVRFEGTYSLLGMMLIGVGLANVEKVSLDIRFTLMTFLAKFIVWPVLVLGIILIDKTVFHFYTEFVYKIMILMSLVPLAANAVAFSSQLNVHPEKTSIAVLLSTLIALFYIPLVLSFIF